MGLKDIMKKYTGSEVPTEEMWRELYSSSLDELNKKCKWTVYYTWHWNTGCGLNSQYKSDKWEYCPHCGAKLIVVDS